MHIQTRCKRAMIRFIRFFTRMDFQEDFTKRIILVERNLARVSSRFSANVAHDCDTDRNNGGSRELMEASDTRHIVARERSWALMGSTEFHLTLSPMIIASTHHHKLYTGSIFSKVKWRARNETISIPKFIRTNVCKMSTQRVILSLAFIRCYRFCIKSRIPVSFIDT